ncbi:RCC1 domain-containing protein 1 [Odontomachus brunneus]|uniref:RCC1 domain-containing protein 1 n=1 Tax=Odontomachus brunneus TaxID=486640 RepID=UPI0013F222F6|nr:RCC1 domain-containing protein 1 [Odontomachus brunneus]XP_032680007.1 RCC1 domain-containing protein 1 [Odontomachus brunneus]XP_032680008.1 RCC1 domain-containing protein 1 [Odontomachus brunneus]XP_032680009.1 RCC1 domain-containing protein 1 [Odontomachus brunneus]XP_032680010.1 RCC1 domain-containing protein 1 [Odontomachus brunneus]
MRVYYTGFNASPLFTCQDGIITSISQLTEIPFSEITNIEIGWNYFLLWRGTELYITGKISENENDERNGPRLIQIPQESSGSCKIAIAGRDNVIILSARNEIWKYKMYDDSWQKVTPFILSNDNLQTEYAIKMSQAGCTVVLTNLGRVFNVPILVEIPKRVKFTDIASGFDHTILLAENGDVYSMGMGTRGQLGHNDLEDCDNPRLIEALAGLRVVHISAGGWHSAVVTDQGDLYTWGWNTNGELGIESEDTKVHAVPTLIDLKTNKSEDSEINVKSVECGNAFTICLTDDGSFWGCGTNKYGQLGVLQQNLDNPRKFVRLNIGTLDPKTVKRFKCREWGTAIITE